MEEEEYKDAARIYSEMIVLGDSLFRVYTGERVEDMRKDYTIDELELQNSAQQKRSSRLFFPCGGAFFKVVKNRLFCRRAFAAHGK